MIEVWYDRVSDWFCLNTGEIIGGPVAGAALTLNSETLLLSGQPLTMEN